MIASALLLLSLSYGAQAQEPNPTEATPAKPVESSEEGWKFEIAPVIWLPSTDLKLSYGNRAVGGVIRPQDLQGRIQFGACGHAEARNGDWGVMGDGFYVNLAEDVTFRNVSGSLRFNETVLQASGFYRAQHGDVPVDVLFGLRLYDFGISNSFTRDGLIFTQAYNAERSRSWVDPVIGLRTSFPLSDDFRFGLYGDVGGFGMGSDFSYRVSGSFNYAASESVSLALGYAAMGTRYRSGSGLGVFDLDLDQYGPTFEFRFKF